MNWRLVLYTHFFACQLISGQSIELVKIHSHNDYNQSSPFWTAYHVGAESIEADVFLKNNELYVTHAEDEIIEERTLEEMYLIPLDSVCQSGLAKIKSMVLLIDIKSEAYSTLAAIEKTLKKYPRLIHHSQLIFVISGERPPPADYPKYPSFIYFDYQSREEMNEDRILDKIAMVSLDFRDYSSWDGTGEMPITDKLTVKEIVKNAKSMRKYLRFWGTPDTPEAWTVFSSLGVNYINTDWPVLCTKFFRDIR